jgi:hypothetical protein
MRNLTPIVALGAFCWLQHARAPARKMGIRKGETKRASRFPRKERLHMPGSLTTSGRPGARAVAPEYVAFHHMHGVGTQNRKLSRLNGWPMRTPVNASPRPSRATAHDSGPMWIATPSSQGTCTLYSLPVSRRFAYVCRSTSDSCRKRAVSALTFSAKELSLNLGDGRGQAAAA